MVTVSELAKKKKMPVKFLASLGVRQQGGAIAIPYKHRDGSEARLRLRVGLSSKDGFRWEPSGEIVPYGLWLLHEGYVILVEGESDCWALWHMGHSALGIPGATSVKFLNREHLDGVNKIYAWQETDDAGVLFVQGVAKRLHEISWSGDAYVLGVSGHKDPSDLYVNDRKNFDKVMAYVKMRAKPIRYDPPKPKEKAVKKFVAGDRSLVDQARAYPLDDLVESKKGLILCPFHDDTRPSAWIKNGFGYCFACGKRFDSIEYIRKIKGIEFMEAVKYLCGK